MTTAAGSEATSGGTGELFPQLTIGSLADLDAVAPAAGTVRTISFSGLVTNPQIVVPAGETFLYTETGILASTSAFGGGFVFDVDGPAISGPVVMDGITVVNINTGANAWCLAASTTMGRLLIIDACFFSGIRGILFSTILGIAIITNSAISGSIVGMRCDGQIFAVRHTLLGIANLQPGGVAIDIADTTVILADGTIAGTSPGFSLVAGQWAHTIGDLVTVPSGALLQLSAAVITGPQGLMFRQDPGDMSVDDDRLLVSGSSSDNWHAILDASRTDAAPLLIPYPAFPPAAPTPIPYSTGAGAEIEVESSAHWLMVKDDPSAGDLYFEYVGEKANSGQVLTITVLVDRNAGTGPINLLWERDTNPATDTWSTITTTVQQVDNTNSFRQLLGASGDDTFNRGDRVRPSSENLSDAVSARLYSIKLSIRGV